MHNGSKTTLEEVVDFYSKGAQPNPYLDREIRPLNLSDQEKSDLVAFLRSLSGTARQGDSKRAEITRGTPNARVVRSVPAVPGRCGWLVRFDQAPFRPAFSVLGRGRSPAQVLCDIEKLLTYIDGNHDFVEAYVRDRMPLVRYTKAQGTFLAWLDVSKGLDKIGASRAAAEASTSRRRVTPEAIPRALVRREREGAYEPRLVVPGCRPHADEPGDNP